MRRSIPVISKTWFTTFTTETLASCVLDCKDILILGDIHRGMENKNYGILGNHFAWFSILFWLFSNFCMLHCHDIIEKNMNSAIKLIFATCCNCLWRSYQTFSVLRLQVTILIFHVCLFQNRPFFSIFACLTVMTSLKKTWILH